ncbi:hypothetical protein LTR56_019593 [Elasticomyces elasticus]|nr:hypothetical protein LTR56_019593 [Elasticomyces elasticus]
MAFQQPQQRPQAVRTVSFSNQVDAPIIASPVRKRTIDESQEWILFSPQSDRQSHTTSQTPRTATDLGSLETHVRSQPGSCEEATCHGTDPDDDNAELDSLDDGLHAFHHTFSASSNPLDHSGGTVLPTHDGLGTFPSAAGFQEQLWQFERYNPHRRRHVRRRSSIQRRLDEVEEEVEIDVTDDRTARIEKWRLEQSKAVLEEIERETKRRQRRMSRMSGGSVAADAGVDIREIGAPRIDSVREGSEPAKSTLQPEQPSESWWQRLTRRVIQDLIGIDETTLSVIFGEELPADPSPTPTQPSPLAAAARQESMVTFHESTYDWELKLLDRVAKELGVLVHQLSEHEGAFSSYREQSEHTGLPVPTSQTRQPSLRQRRRMSSDRVRTTPSDALFAPTLQRAPTSPMEETDTSLWGIEEEPSQPISKEEAAKQQQEREYWERDIDVNVIFSYLRRRFSSKPAPEPENGPLPASWTTNSASALGTSPESLRRAEVIRRQHPLVSRAAERAAAQSRRRDSLLRRHQMQQIMQKRGAGETSSCASQSTKRSRHSKSGSSRHYWLEGGGSVGSIGSGPAMSSGLGGWGEV